MFLGAPVFQHTMPVRSEIPREYVPYRSSMWMGLENLALRLDVRHS